MPRFFPWILFATALAPLACDYSDLNGEYGKSSTGGAGAGGVAGSTSAGNGSGGSAGSSGASGQGGSGAGGASGQGGNAGSGSSGAGQGGAAGEGGAAGMSGGSGDGGDGGIAGAGGGGAGAGGGEGGSSGTSGQSGSGGDGGASCGKAEDCPGQDGACAVRTCEAGVCGFKLEPAGTAVGEDIVGDCRRFECDDKGLVVAVTDPQDLPDDKIECTDDLCNGQEVEHPAKKAGEPCNSGGGKVCNGAGACVVCVVGADCASGICQGNVCVAAACTDGVKNGTETDKDCGGSCGSCADGKLCGGAADCQSGVCSGGKCAAPSCTDKVKNGSETEVDCGGSCPACPRLLVFAAGSAGALGAERGSAGDWSIVGISGGASNQQPSLALGSGGGLGMLRSASGDFLLFSTWKNGVWSSLGLVGATVTTRDRPATVALGASFGVAFHGNDFKHYYAAFNGSVWSSVEGIGPSNAQSFGPSAPALAQVSGDPFVEFAGQNGDLFDQSRAGGAWSAASAHSLGDVTNSTPAVLALPTAGEVLVVSRWKADGSLRSTMRKGGTWSAPVMIPNALSDDTPALAAIPGGALVAFRGTDGKLYWSGWNGSNWTTAAAFSASNPKIKSAPSLCKGLLGDAELAFVEDNAAGSVVHATFTSGKWGDPTKIGGSGLLGAAIGRTP